METRSQRRKKLNHNDRKVKTETQSTKKETPTACTSRKKKCENREARKLIPKEPKKMNMKMIMKWNMIMSVEWTLDNQYYDDSFFKEKERTVLFEINIQDTPSIEESAPLYEYDDD